jgi:hypothetical protein
LDQTNEPRFFVVALKLTWAHVCQNMTGDMTKCPKCGGGMRQGFVPDYSYQRTYVAGWQEGPPKQSIWTGSPKAPKDRGVPIGAFRCEKCGFLEFYADPKFAVQ